MKIGLQFVIDTYQHEKFLNEFDYAWTSGQQQQQHIEQYAQEIKLKLEQVTNSPAIIPMVQDSIDRAFNDMTSSVESLTIDLNLLNTLTVALADLKQMIRISISN
jgi:hypothetical protein